MNTVTTAPIPGAEYAAYRKVLADEAGKAPSEWTFKSNPAYRQILEHVSHAQGLEYLSVLNASSLWGFRARTIVAETALENDRLGKPERADFSSLGIFCSPTNLRYAAQAMAILERVEEISWPVNIIEIGGGYGGLALFVRRLAPLFGPGVQRYMIADLPEAGTIQQAYAKRRGLKVRVVDGTDPQSIRAALSVRTESIWFLVSAYAFSEFSPEVRAWYEQTVISHCPHGYLVWNMIPVYPFTSAPLTIEDERPLTGPGNKVVTF